MNMREAMEKAKESSSQDRFGTVHSVYTHRVTHEGRVSCYDGPMAPSRKEWKLVAQFKNGNQLM